MSDKEMIDISSTPFLVGLRWATSPTCVIEGRPIDALRLAIKIPGEPEQQLTLMVVPSAFTILKESIAEHEEFIAERGTPHAENAETEKADTT